MTRNPKFGVNYRSWNVLIRLLGADIAHAGSLTGRYLLTLEPVPSKKFVNAEKIMYRSREESIKEAVANINVLTFEDFKKSSGEKIKKVFPLIAGGINPANIEYNVRLLGNDIILLVGSGLFKSPKDNKFEAVQSTVRALRQSLDIIMSGRYVCDVATDRNSESKFRDLVKYYNQHVEEFLKWDWRKQPIRIREMDRLKPCD
jgi:ribulose 1,5-bisphosphate carboxylase large subunit-like protein